MKRTAPGVPIILLSDAEETSQVVEALECGARGYIPTSASLSIAIEAMRLVRAGGVYAPAGSLIAASSQKYANGNSGHQRMFTERQNDVLEALCQGKANKIIAYELKLRESTVKIHVRNIMMKLNARKSHRSCLQDARTDGSRRRLEPPKLQLALLPRLHGIDYSDDKGSFNRLPLSISFGQAQS